MIGIRRLRNNAVLVGGFLCLSMLAGCSANLVAIRQNDMPGASIRMPASAAGVVDRREAFAPHFCRNLREQAVPADAANTCRGWLRLSEPSAPDEPPHAPNATPRTIVIIPGIFGECVAASATPFSDAYALLRERGHRIHVIEVEGRSSSKRNGRIIDAWMSEHAAELQDAVVIAYSKGTTDFMHAAVVDAGERRWMGRVAALVTVSGVVSGTPLATRGRNLYDKLLSNMRLPDCGVGDGGGVGSLTYRESLGIRARYLASANLPATYAVVAITDARSINPVLAPFHGQLVQLDERNDGQVLIEDAILPGSRLIASASADHWSIALPFETSGKGVRFLSRNNHFPRVAFVLALLDFIDTPAADTAP